VSQVIIQATSRLCPLVAVQPIYLHPYAVATLVASLGHLYRRRVYLNMVAGGFVNDLTALDDPTPHDAATTDSGNTPKWWRGCCARPAR